jgi:hypothetical protein
MWKNVGKTALLFVTLTMGIGYAGAQDAVDPALLTPVEAALESTRALDSLRISTQSLTESSAQFGDLSIQNRSEVDLVRAESDEEWNASGSISLTSELPVIGTLDIGAEMVRLDGVTYVRFGELPDALPLELPEAWTATDELESNGGILPLPTTPDALLGALLLPIATDSVTAIAALPDDEIDGQTMRVTQISLDPALLLESDAADLLLVDGSRGGFGGGNRPGGFTPPAGAQPPAEIVPPSPEDIQVTLAVYVGADDGYLHRIYLLINIAGSEDRSRPASTVTTISDYSNFGEPVEITMPQ